MNMKGLFTGNEIKDIILTIMALTVIFAFPNYLDLPIYLVAIIIGFLLHELAHKFMARKFGMAAYYRMWPTGIIFGLLLAGFGLLTNTPLRFVAPGAVVIYPYRFGRWGYRIKHLTTREEGLVSVVGPGVNVFFAFLFMFIPIPGALFISTVNAFLAFFNLLPIPPLDGIKVLKWNIAVWVFLIILSALMVLQII